MTTEAVNAAAHQDNVRADVFLFIDSVPPVRLCTVAGIYDLAPGGAVDTEGGEYLGFGSLTGVPVLNQFINGVAQRIDLVMSGTGITSELLDLADSEADIVRNADVYIGLMLWDEDYQPIGPMRWLTYAQADTPRLTHQPSEDPTQPSVRQVTLSIGTAMTGRRRPRMQFYTGIEQRRAYPTDAFCDRANKYADNSTVRWPK